MTFMAYVNKNRFKKFIFPLFVHTQRDKSERPYNVCVINDEYMFNFARTLSTKALAIVIAKNLKISLAHYEWSRAHIEFARRLLKLQKKKRNSKERTRKKFKHRLKMETSLQSESLYAVAV